MKHTTRTGLPALLFLVFITSGASGLNAQYKNDNQTYKTVYLEDLCTALQQHPGYLLLDVRSRGEYADTSQFAGANIGHLQNAINIDVRELDKRLAEISPYKDKPIFVYCSHSQRSRRASTLLAENGFRQVYNINEGLSGIHLKGNAIVGCASQLYDSKNAFKLIGATELVSLLKQPGKAVLYDLRSDSSYNGIASNEKLNAFGRIKGAARAADELALFQAVSSLPKSKTILLVDEFGAGGMAAATKLAEQGFTDVRVMLEGMDRWMATSPNDLPEKRDWWVTSTPYQVITATELDAWHSRNSQAVFVDIRDSLPFANKAADAYLNKGNIKDAVNIPFARLEQAIAAGAIPNDRPVLLYHFSSQPETFRAAKMLAGRGYKNVAVLSGGLFGLRWQAANIRGREGLNRWVVNIPPDGF